MTTQVSDRSTFTRPAGRNPLRRPESRSCPEQAPLRPEILHRLSPWARRASVEKCLPKASMLLLPGDHSGEILSTIEGMAWITQAGSPEDIILAPGETHAITRKGTVLIEGLVKTRLKISGDGS